MRIVRRFDNLFHWVVESIEDHANPQNFAEISSSLGKAGNVESIKIDILNPKAKAL